MRFRRAAFRGRGRRSREPLNWDRIAQVQAVDTSGVYSTLVSVTLFDPTTVVAGSQDLRLTVRRIRFEWGVKLVYGAGANVPQVIYAGVYPRRATEAIADPSFANASDQRADWMWHSAIGVLPATAAFTLFLAQDDNVIDGSDRSSIRVNRKLDQDMLITLVTKIQRDDPAADALPTVSRQVLTAGASTLYSRSMRR